jgi:hypothetical protein
MIYSLGGYNRNKTPPPMQFLEVAIPSEPDEYIFL